MHTYDPKKVDLVFAGIYLNEGVADGTFFTYASNAPGFSKKIGVSGEVTRSRSHDRSGSIRLVLMQSSAVNKRLSDLYKQDRAGVNGQGVGAFFLQDRAGDTLLTASRAYIADDPDLTLDATATTREWLIELADVDIDHGGITLD